MEPTPRCIIAFKGLKPGTYDYGFALDGALFRAFESPEIKDGSLQAAVRMERTESQLTLDVTVEGRVVVPCDRCLEDCTLPVAYEGRLLVRFADEPAEYDGDVLWLHPSEEEVDLAQYLYESVVLSLPYRRVHPEGACDAEMLKRFRIVSGEEFAAIEERAAGNTEPLGDEQRQVLEQLRRQIEQEQQEAARPRGAD